MKTKSKVSMKAVGNVKGGKYSDGASATFDKPPAFSGSHRKSTSVPKFKGAGTNFANRKVS